MYVAAAAGSTSLTSSRNPVVSPANQSQPSARVAPSGAGRSNPVPSPCRFSWSTVAARVAAVPTAAQSAGMDAAAVVSVGALLGVPDWDADTDGVPDAAGSASSG